MGALRQHQYILSSRPTTPQLPGGFELEMSSTMIISEWHPNIPSIIKRPYLIRTQQSPTAKVAFVSNSPVASHAETPQEKAAVETPQRETTSETPKQETAEETPQQEIVTGTPWQETVAETPQKEAIAETASMIDNYTGHIPR